RKKGVTPCGPSVLQQRKKRKALYGLGNGHSCQFEQCWSYIDIQNELFELRARFDELWETYQKGISNGFIIGPTFIRQAVFSPKEAVITGENNNRVIELA